MSQTHLNRFPKGQYIHVHVHVHTEDTSLYNMSHHLTNQDTLHQCPDSSTTHLEDHVGSQEHVEEQHHDQHVEPRQKKS